MYVRSQRSDCVWIIRCEFSDGVQGKIWKNGAAGENAGKLDKKFTRRIMKDSVRILT